MVSYNDLGLKFHFWIKIKAQNFWKDTRVLKELKKFDLIIMSECIPNAFLRKMYNVEKLKGILKKAVGLYEVFYLGNAPTQMKFLEKNKNSTLDRYDFHFSVSNVTELRKKPTNKWFPIGIDAERWTIRCLPKKEFIAVVDFKQPGYEKYREIQIQALTEAGIKYISLEREYSLDEIRQIYQEATIFFLQFPEAFGMPILECLCGGCQIFTPDSSWPMSWRLNENPRVHGEGLLPECFTVYNNKKQLVKELIIFEENYDFVKSPRKVFNIFLDHYPEFYFGNEHQLNCALGKLQAKINKNVK